MILNQTGLAAEGLHVIGDPGVPVFLLEGESPLLVDAGFACMGPLYVESINQTVNGSQPAHLCLTHSHFDHCGAVRRLQLAYPGMEVCCSPKAREVFSRPGAIEVIKSLNSAAEQMLEEQFGRRPSDDSFQPFEVTRTLVEDDVLEVSPGLTVRVVETPGHTRDCLSYYSPERKLLFASEAAGIPNPDGYIICDMLVDYDMYVRSLEKLTGLDVEILVLGHNLVLTDEDARGYLPRALHQCEVFKNWVWGLLREHAMDEKKVLAQVRQKEYDDTPFPKQPEPAYMLNLKARVRAVKNKMTQAA